jgi:hypothetical protein
MLLAKVSVAPGKSSVVQLASTEPIVSSNVSPAITISEDFIFSPFKKKLM